MKKITYESNKQSHDNMMTKFWQLNFTDLKKLPLTSSDKCFSN